jgi:hypothetical protein
MAPGTVGGRGTRHDIGRRKSATQDRQAISIAFAKLGGPPPLDAAIKEIPNTVHHSSQPDDSSPARTQPPSEDPCRSRPTISGRPAPPGPTTRPRSRGERPRPLATAGLQDPPHNPDRSHRETPGAKTSSRIRQTTSSSNHHSPLPSLSFQTVTKACQSQDAYQRDRSVYSTTLRICILYGSRRITTRPPGAHM